MPEQVMPFQDCPHGSSPLGGQPSWGGEFIFWNKNLTAAAASNTRKFFFLKKTQQPQDINYGNSLSNRLYPHHHPFYIFQGIDYSSGKTNPIW